MTYELHSVERALEVIALLARMEKGTLTALAQQMKTNQTTLLRTMRVLERHGYVRRLPDGREYGLGLSLIEIGAVAARHIDMVAYLRPALTALAHEFGVTAHIGLLRDGAVTIIEKIDPPVPMVRYSTLGIRLPLNATGVGKAALALKPSDRMHEIGLRPPLVSYTRHTICDTALLAAEVDRTRARGFSIEAEEFNIGYSCVGTALSFNGQDFAMSLSGTALPLEELQRRGERLRDAVAGLVSMHGGIAQSLTTLAPAPLNQHELPASIMRRELSPAPIK